MLSELMIARWFMLHLSDNRMRKNGTMIDIHDDHDDVTSLLAEGVVARSRFRCQNLHMSAFSFRELPSPILTEHQIFQEEYNNKYNDEVAYMKAPSRLSTM